MYRYHSAGRRGVRRGGKPGDAGEILGRPRARDPRVRALFLGPIPLRAIFNERVIICLLALCRSSLCCVRSFQDSPFWHFFTEALAFKGYSQKRRGPAALGVPRRQSRRLQLAQIGLNICWRSLTIQLALHTSNCVFSIL